MTAPPPPGWTPPEDIPAGLSPAHLDWCRRHGVTPPATGDQAERVADLLRRAFGT